MTTGVRIVSQTAPSYPDDARDAGAEGVVRLVVEVLADGSPGEIEIEVTSGWRSLDDAAVAAVRRWRFAAATIDGVPCRARVRVPPIRFRLDV
ncbi:MAG: hypothetical protein HMLKMBBP_02057 [Planctomycetes bacterium]|nr:hypothetical protein [Planctomycetota bacterium]